MLSHLGLQHDWLLSLPPPTKSIEGPTLSSSDISKRRLFTPDWLEKCKKTLPGPACSLLCLLGGRHLSSHGLSTGNEHPAGTRGYSATRKHQLMVQKNIISEKALSWEGWEAGPKAQHQLQRDATAASATGNTANRHNNLKLSNLQPKLSAPSFHVSSLNTDTFYTGCLETLS